MRKTKAAKKKTAAAKPAAKPIERSDRDYEQEVWTASKWRMEHFNENYWAIIGSLMTPSDRFVRDEVVGVATKDEAKRIIEAHNQEIAELEARLAKRATKG